MRTVMSNDKTRCETCEQDFQNNIDRIVREGRAPRAPNTMHTKRS